MKNYIIVIAVDEESLERNVNDMMDLDYIPTGGISITEAKLGYKTYAQAMVLKESRRK